MASKVNTKFAVTLGVALVCVCAIVVFIYVKMVNKSAADSLAEAQAEMAKGDIEKAIPLFGRAVFKEPNNPAYLKAWIDALAQSQPTTQQGYSERYSRDYVGALRKLADVRKIDLEPHEAVLGLYYRRLKLFVADPQPWVDLVTDVTRTMEYFRDADPKEATDKAIIGRYRGLARVGLMERNFDMTEEDRKQAFDDLDAALKARPNDAQTMFGLAQWQALTSARLRQRNRADEADAMLQDSKKRLQEFVKANPMELAPAFALVRIELAESVRDNAAKSTPAQMQLIARPKVQALLDLAAKQDFKTVDELTLIECIGLGQAAAVENAADQAKKLIDALIAARPNDPVIRYQAGEIARGSGRLEDAIATYQAVVDMPGLPLSLEGLLLLEFRPIAVREQASVAVAMAMQAKPEERKAAIERARKYRDEYAKRASGDTRDVMLLDGKIAYLAGENVDARKLLSNYIDQAPRANPEAMLMLADILLKQDSLGAAREMLNRALAVQPNNPRAMVANAQIELRLNNAPEAVRQLEAAAALEPQNQEIAALLERARQVQKGSDSKNPVIAAISKANALITAVPGDPVGALKLLKETAKTADEDAPVMIALITALAQMNDRESAKTVTDRALVKAPDDARLKDIKELLESGKIEEVQRRRIEAGTGDEFQKAIALFLSFQREGNTKVAEEWFQKAKALRPNDPLVVSRDFDDLLIAKKWAEASALADKAAELDLDKLKGLVFKTRLEAVQGRLKEATAFAVQMTEIDSLNAVPWRMLAELRLQQGQTTEATEAATRAVRIKPNDIKAVVLLARCKVLAGQYLDALTLCREKLTFGGEDPDFINLWLELEGQVGDPNAAVDRRMRVFNGNPKDRLNTAAYLRLLLSAGGYAEAKKVMDQVEADGWSKDITPLKALYYAGQGQNVEAKKVLDEAIAGIPEKDRTVADYLNFSRSMMQLNAVPLAVSLLEDGRKLQSPENMEVERELGDIYFNSGQNDKAIECYRRALDSIKKDEGSLLTQRMAEALVRANKLDEADSTLEKVTATDGKDRSRLSVLKAEIATLKKDVIRARKQLDEAVAADPQSFLAYYKRAALNLNDPAFFNDAKADLEQVLRLNSQFSPARELLAFAFAKEGNTDRAFAMLRDGVDLNPNDDELRVKYISALNGNQKYAEAIASAEDALKRTGQLRWSGMIADMYAGQRKWPEAARYYGQLWATNPGNEVAPRYITALLNQTSPDLKTSREVIQSPSLKIDEYAPMRMLRAWVLMRSGETKAAETNIAEAFKLLKQDSMGEVDAWFRDLLRVYARPGDTKPRIDEATKFLASIRPKEGFPDPAELQLARLQLSDEKLRPAALATVEKLLYKDTSPTVVYNAALFLGSEQQSRKDYEGVVKTYKRGLELVPKDPQLLNNVGYITAVFLKNPAEGLPYIRQAAEIKPNDANIQDSLGAVLLLTGEVNEAERILTRARELATTPFEKSAPTIHLIEAKLAKGDRSAADELFRDLQRLIDSEPEPKRIQVNYREEIDRVRAKVQG